MEAGFLQSLDERGKVFHPKHNAVPAAGFLRLTVRHRPGPGRLRSAEQNLGFAERDARERRQLLMYERKAKMSRVERDRTCDIFDYVSDAMNALHGWYWHEDLYYPFLNVIGPLARAEFDDAEVSETSHDKRILADDGFQLFPFLADRDNDAAVARYLSP